MASQSSTERRRKNSALYRVESRVGFNARVEPMWYTFDRLRGDWGFLERWKRKRATKRLATRVNARLEKLGAAANDWDTRKGKCVCNLRVSKMGLPRELRDWMAGKLSQETYRAWPHILAQRENDAIILPSDFEQPFKVGMGDHDVIVTSSPRLKAELEAVNNRLQLEEGFALKKMGAIDFVDAKEKDIAIYESRFSTMDDFWPRFTYVLLKKLSDKSVESGFPVLFA